MNDGECQVRSGNKSFGYNLFFNHLVGQFSTVNNCTFNNNNIILSLVVISR